jgi:hypothetical protein
MTVMHDSDCSVHNEPALPSAPCDCSAWPKEYHRLHMAALKAYAAPEGEENYAAFAAADDALWAFVKHNIHTKEKPLPVGWWCSHCQCVVSPASVTFQETHDVRVGGCGHSVGNIPAISPQNPASTEGG